MSNDFSKFLTEDRRLAILRLLADQGGYSMNESVLQTALEMLGHNVSRDRVKSDMAWLGEQGTLELGEVSGVMVAKLTKRGEDIALGRSTVPGIKRPSPGA